MLEQVLGKLRWVSIVAVVAAFAGGLLMLYVGAQGMFDAILSYVRMTEQPEVGLKFTALIRVVEALDAFLVALALLIFSAGVFSLFIEGTESTATRWMPDALRPRTLGDLKQTLAEIIILVLLVLYLDEVLQAQERASWDLIGMPAAIALLALAVRMIGFRHET